jgi:hypothetical protein
VWLVHNQRFDERAAADKYSEQLRKEAEDSENRLDAVLNHFLSPGGAAYLYFRF